MQNMRNDTECLDKKADEISGGSGYGGSQGTNMVVVPITLPPPFTLEDIFARVWAEIHTLVGLVSTITERIPQTQVAVPESGNDVMTTEQAAAFLKLTTKTVREGAARGIIPAKKYPDGSKRGTWLFCRNELEKWILPKHKKTLKREVSIYT